MIKWFKFVSDSSRESIKSAPAEDFSSVEALIFMGLQQKLWVNSGSGKSPKV